MKYLVTGGTGFIGRFLVHKLLERGGTVYVLVRSGSKHKLKALQETWPSTGQVIPLTGDIAKAYCGISAAKRKELSGNIDHVFHLAALYDLRADDAHNRAINVEGTRNVVKLANALAGKAILHHVSSIAVAGAHRGLFEESMFDEGQKLEAPYFVTKFEAEKTVRESSTIPWRIYRPGIVIGSSQTGEIDKIDGPYYFFKLIQNIRNILPAWIPMIGLEGSEVNLVPVDYVANAMDAIAHAPNQNRTIGDLNGKAFHLVDPAPLGLGDASNEFCRAAHAPEFAMRIDTRLGRLIPPGVRFFAGQLPVLNNAWKQTVESLGIPSQSFQYMLHEARFPCPNTDAVLAGSGISCPPLRDYAWKIWDYWERNLDPGLFKARSLDEKLKGKKVLVTGATSGIGLAVAQHAARHGAEVILVARRLKVLEEVRANIVADGGVAHLYSCDLTDMDKIRELAAQVLKDHECVDILVNNAGRSIRRTIAESYDRFHDFERTMQLNYFGAVSLIMGLLPAMREHHDGHIINISSIGVQTNAPRFSAYVASKAALDAFSRCVSSEIMADGIEITTIHMPLVRTPMIAPTRIYKYFPAISPDDAADMVLGAMLERPKTVSTRLGTFTSVMYSLTPKLVDYIQNIGYRLFPASGKKGDEPEMSTEGMAFAHLMKGIHW